MDKTTELDIDPKTVYDVVSVESVHSSGHFYPGFLIGVRLRSEEPQPLLMFRVDFPSGLYPHKKFIPEIFGTGPENHHNFACGRIQWFLSENRDYQPTEEEPLAILEVGD